MLPDFSVRECFVVAWARFRERPWFLMGITFLSWVVAFVSAQLTEDVYRHIEPTRSIIDFLFSIGYYWIYFGLMVAAFNLLDHKPVTWAGILVFDQRFVFYLVGAILYSLVVTLGLVFFVIPGIYFALRYGFFWCAVVDGRKTVFEAFHESARITLGVKWRLILFGLAMFGVILVGFLALGVGVLAAVPIVILATTHLYRALLSQAPSAATAVVETTTSVQNVATNPTEK